MKNMILSLVSLLLSFSLLANVIEAPKEIPDFKQNPSVLLWKHIITKHFDIIFPAELEEEAQRVAHLLEKAYPYVGRSLEVNPPRIPLVLQNQSTISNGFVTLAPRRSEWYVTPAVDPELTNTEWLKTLAIHEFRHVVQFEKTRQGFNKVFEFFLGEIGQGLGLGLTLPPWFLEGDAVGIETALTKGGRGRLPLFDRDLRTLILSGQKWNYDKAHLGSYEDYVPNHYVYGYFYTSWLRNKYGDLFLSKLANNASQSSYNPLTFYNSVDRLTGESFESFYKEMLKDLLKEWRTKASLMIASPFKVENIDPKFGWTNYSYPQKTSTSEILALKKGLSFIDQFVLLNGKKEKTLFYPGPLHNEYPYKLRNDRLAFFEMEVDPRWGYRDFSRLKVYDLKKDKFVVDKRGTKGRLAVLDQQGEKIAFVEWNQKQGQFIVTLDQRGNEIGRVPFPKERVITSLDWLSQDELVFVSRNREDLKSVSIYNLSTLSEEVLIPDVNINFGFISVEDGQILLESPESGMDNIWFVTKEGRTQLTSSRFGAYAPTISQGQLIYNDYSVSGMNIVTKTLPWNSQQKSSDSFYPIYEKFSKAEGFSSLQSDFLEKEKYLSRPYSQFKNSINFHSWQILAPPLSSTLTLAAYGRDILNTLTLSAGTVYDLNEQTLKGFVSSLWSYYYPVFDLRAGYGNRRQDVLKNSKRIENKWEEGTLEAGMEVPWNFIQGRFSHSFSARVFSKIIKVTNKLSNDLTEMSDGSLHSPGLTLSYGTSSRMSRRDINPEWALFLNYHLEEGKNISGPAQKGSLTHVDGKFFVPGAWYHHSFYHEVSYEKQRSNFYEYSSMTLYPRGTKSFFLDEFLKYSGNYTMPLFYPDWNLSRYFYLKRIALNLFYDDLSGRFEGISYHAASTGWEALFEMNVVRIFIPFTIGIRGNYVLDGVEKEDSYEIFLASVLGTF